MTPAKNKKYLIIAAIIAGGAIVTRYVIYPALKDIFKGGKDKDTAPATLPTATNVTYQTPTDSEDDSDSNAGDYEAPAPSHPLTFQAKDALINEIIYAADLTGLPIYENLGDTTAAAWIEYGNKLGKVISKTANWVKVVGYMPYDWFHLSPVYFYIMGVDIVSTNADL